MAPMSADKGLITLTDTSLVVFSPFFIQMNLKPQSCVLGHQVCHSKSGEINPVKVGNLVKAYVDKYKHARKHKKGDDSGKTRDGQCEAIRSSDSP